jgi:hypothetical protein
MNIAIPSRKIKLNIISSTKNIENEGQYERTVLKELQDLVDQKKEKVILNSYMMSNGENKGISELQIGDQLMAEDSTPCKILDIQKVKEKAYLLEPIKGESFIIGESEILSLSHTNSNKISWTENSQEYIVEYFDKISKRFIKKCFTVKSCGSKEEALEAAKKYFLENEIDENDENIFEIFIKECVKTNYPALYKIYRKSLDFPHKEFEIDPYIIGLWLGDGSHRNTIITSADKEIVDYLKEYFEDFGLTVKSDDINHRITSGKHSGNYPGKNRFKEILREYNLLFNKHIPDDFLFTSRENRLRLLAGLLDSDGSLDSNCYDFIQKREDLFNQVIFLARSLGFSCYKNPCIKICTNAANGPKPGIYYRCCISGEGIEEIPTLLDRKKAHERRQIKRAYVTGFQLKDLGEREITRIITDKPRYLMSDFTVRHRYENEENNDEKKIIEIKEKKITGAPFGYKVQARQIVIDEKEGEIVRKIFEMYYNKISLEKISNELNILNYKTRKGTIFTPNILASIINYKEKYLGTERENGEHWPKLLQDEKYSKDRDNKYKNPIFGYKKVENGEFVIKRKEAEIVRLIDSEYKKGTTRKEIVSILNATEIRSKMGGEWTQNKLNSIIRNREKYRNGISYPKILE